MASDAHIRFRECATGLYNPDIFGKSYVHRRRHKDNSVSKRPWKNKIKQNTQLKYSLKGCWHFWGGGVKCWGFWCEGYCRFNSSLHRRTQKRKAT